MLLAMKTPVLLVLLALSSLAATLHGGDVPVRVVTATGDPAPGLPPGVAFDSFSGPRVDAAGRVAFYARIVGTGVTAGGEQSVWSESAGSLALVARQGQPAPGTLGASFATLFGGIQPGTALGLDVAGRTSFLAVLAGGDVCDCNFNGVLDNHTGWFSTKPGALSLLARADSQAPGFAPGVTFDTLAPPQVSRDGFLVQLLAVKGPGIGFGNGFAIFSDAGGSLLPVVQQGDPAPGFPSTHFEFLGSPMPGLDGELSFFAALAGPGIGQFNDDSLWALRDGGLELVLREGGVLASGEVIGNPSLTSAFFNASVKGGRRSACAAHLAGGGSGVLAEHDGAIAVVARTGDPVPGLPATVKFQSCGSFNFDGPIVLNDAGQLAFMARLNTPNPSNESLWTFDPATGPKLVARGGDSPPDAPPGVVFTANAFGFVPVFGPPANNARGQVAFDANVGKPGDPIVAGGRALYATDTMGALRKVLQPGDLVDLAGDGSEVHAVVSVAFNKDGQSLETYNGTTFGDDGTIVFRATFEGGFSAVLTVDVDPFQDLGGGLPGNGEPRLEGKGILLPGTPGSLDLTGAVAAQPAVLFVSLATNPTPLLGGTLLAFPPMVVVALVTGPAGSFSLPFTVPGGLPAAAVFFQAVVADAGAPVGVAFSNALVAQLP